MSPVIITLLFLAFAIVMFIFEKIPLGLTATIVAVGLNVTGVLSASDTFAGYVNSNVILCVGMFVVGQALFETGMAHKIGGLVTRFANSASYFHTRRSFHDKTRKHPAHDRDDGEIHRLYRQKAAR